VFFLGQEVAGQLLDDDHWRVELLFADMKVKSKKLYKTIGDMKAALATGNGWTACFAWHQTARRHLSNEFGKKARFTKNNSK
jgi:hypothetical protein